MRYYYPRSKSSIKFTVIAVLVYISLGMFIMRKQEGIEKEYVQRSHLENCTFPALTSLQQYLKYIYTPQAECKSWLELGGSFGAPEDGKKLVCMEPQFNINPDNCVVLSFGINNEWSFEEDAARLGCRVFAFDPTLGLEDHKRTSGINFYNLGISNYRGLKKIGMNTIPTDFNFTKEYPVDTYENILKMLRLTDTPIDILKMDVELSEIDFLQDVLYNTPHLLGNIKQIAMEVHHDVMTGDSKPTSILHVFWPLYHHLHCHGFKIYTSRDGGFFREVLWGRDRDWR